MKLTTARLLLPVLAIMIIPVGCLDSSDGVNTKAKPGQDTYSNTIEQDTRGQQLPQDVKYGDIDITYFGHSMFKIAEQGGESVVTDPFDAAVGFLMPDVSSNYVCISHPHHDHANFDLVKGNPQLVNALGDSIFQEMMFRGIKSFHDGLSGRERGQTIIYKWTLAGVSFAHMGDLGQPELSGSQMTELGKVDVLMIPVGGNYTIGPEQALAIINDVRPKVAIPMHYKTPESTIDITGLPDFTSIAPQVFNKGALVTINKDLLPESTQIWVMDVFTKQP